MTDSINKSVKNWLIISWQHVDHLDACYGKLLVSMLGTREEAEIEARQWIDNFKPVGIVEEFNG